MRTKSPPSLLNADAKLLRASGIASWLRISRSTWFSWVAQGRVPPGIKLSPGVTVWSVDEVAAALGLEVR